MSGSSDGAALALSHLQAIANVACCTQLLVDRGAVGLLRRMRRESLSEQVRTLLETIALPRDEAVEEKEEKQDPALGVSYIVTQLLNMLERPSLCSAEAVDRAVIGLSELLEPGTPSATSVTVFSRSILGEGCEVAGRESELSQVGNSLERGSF